MPMITSTGSTKRSTPPKAAQARPARRRLRRGTSGRGDGNGVRGRLAVASASGSGARAAARSSTSMTTTVMLSSPPASLAASTRRSAARRGSVSSAARRSISSSRIMPVRPSEQIRMRSPVRASIGVEVDVDVGVDAEGPGDDRPLRVDLGLLGRDPALAHELLDEAVILGELLDRTVADAVRARVADVADEQRRLAEDRDRGERRAHARELAVGRGLLEDGRVGEHDRRVERLAARDRGPQRLERGGAGHLAGPVTAHAVGDGVEREPIVDDEAVLVDRCAAARRRSWRPRRSSRATLDAVGGVDRSTVIASPRARSGRPGCGRPCAACAPRSSGAPLTSVPLVEPRSSTNTSPSRSKTRACTLETNVSSGIETPQPAARPIVSSPFTSKARPLAAGGSTTTSRHDRRGVFALAFALGGAGCGTGAAGAGTPRSSDTTVHTTRRGRGRAARGGRT